MITFRTLNPRDKVRYRSVLFPDAVIHALKQVHRIRKIRTIQRLAGGLEFWLWGRTQATKHICSVIAVAGIQGEYATPKGSRYGFGVLIAQKTRYPRLLQEPWWHTKLENAAISMDLVGEEASAVMIAAW